MHANAENVVTPGGADCKSQPQQERGSMSEKNHISDALDEIEERAAIMAEGNGWSQGRAERQIAYERGFQTWGQLVRAAK